MTTKKTRHHKIIHVVTIISTLLAASGLHAEERLPISETLAERTKEFLSDRGRTGSLVGSILAGAAVANPLAPLVGSMAGFLIGKSSAFSNRDSNADRRDAYINRSLTPEDGVQVTSLSGLTGEQSQASEPLAILGLPLQTEADNPSEQTEQIEQTEQTVMLGQSEQTWPENRPDQTEPTLLAGFPEDAEADDQSDQTTAEVSPGQSGLGSRLQQQLAYACSNAQAAQSISSSCYYYSQ